MSQAMNLLIQLGVAILAAVGIAATARATEPVTPEANLGVRPMAELEAVRAWTLPEWRTVPSALELEQLQQSGRDLRITFHREARTLVVAGPPMDVCRCRRRAQDLGLYGDLVPVRMTSTIVH